MITPEAAQKLTDLRSRMLENIKTGKPSHEGITEEDIKIGLSSIRSNRSAAAMSGGKAASKKKAKAAVAIDTKAFTDLDLD